MRGQKFILFLRLMDPIMLCGTCLVIIISLHDIYLELVALLRHVLVVSTCYSKTSCGLERIPEIAASGDL